jgi:hypothetical protein
MSAAPEPWISSTAGNGPSPTVGRVSCALVGICCCISNSIVRSLFSIVCRSCCPSAVEEENIEGKQTDAIIMTAKDIAVEEVFISTAPIRFVLVNIDYPIYQIAMAFALV